MIDLLIDRIDHFVFTPNMTISSRSVLLRYYLSLFVLFTYISIWPFYLSAYILIHLPAQVYRQLMSNKPELERLLVMVQDGAGNSEGEESTISPVNRLVTKK